MLDEQYLKIVKAYNKDKFYEFFDKIKLITNFVLTLSTLLSQIILMFPFLLFEWSLTFISKHQKNTNIRKQIFLLYKKNSVLKNNDNFQNIISLFK